MGAVILFVQAALFAVLSAVVASSKNRNPVKWGVIGALFSLIGLIIALTLDEKESGSDQSTSSSEGGQPMSAEVFDPDEHEKKCPDCAEYIKLEARVCKHCGHEFSEEEVEQQVGNAREKFEEKRQEEDEEMEKASVREDMTVLGIIILVVGGFILVALFAGG